MLFQPITFELSDAAPNVSVRGMKCDVDTRKKLYGNVWPVRWHGQRRRHFFGCVPPCRLVRSEHLLDLAQLAPRVASAMHTETSSGDDPFAKVKRSTLAETKDLGVYFHEYSYVDVVLSSGTNVRR